MSLLSFWPGIHYVWEGTWTIIRTLAQLRWCSSTCGLKSSECYHHHYYLLINCSLTMDPWMSSRSLSPHTNYGYCNISFYSMLQMTTLFAWQCCAMDGFRLGIREDVNKEKCIKHTGHGSRQFIGNTIDN